MSGPSPPLLLGCAGQWAQPRFVSEAARIRQYVWLSSTLGTMHMSQFASSATGQKQVFGDTLNSCAFQLSTSTPLHWRAGLTVENNQTNEKKTPNSFPLRKDNTLPSGQQN